MRLVINTSIARAAGLSPHSTSKICRDFLEAVSKLCHSVVLTRDIFDEWKMHRSNYTSKWLVSMYARKKVCRLSKSENLDLWSKIESSVENDEDRLAMQKDFCLIEAAMATDWIVVSRDENARRLFNDAAKEIGELRNLMWVNPEKAEDQLISWLESGDEPEGEHRLGT